MERMCSCSVTELPDLRDGRLLVLGHVANLPNASEQSLVSGFILGYLFALRRSATYSNARFTTGSTSWRSTVLMMKS